MKRIIEVSDDNSINLNVGDTKVVSKRATLCEIVPKDCFQMHNVGVSLEECGVVALHDITRKHKYALGKHGYQEGTICYKLKLESFQSNNWMLVGVFNTLIVHYRMTSHTDYQVH